MNEKCILIVDDEQRMRKICKTVCDQRSLHRL